MLWSGIALTSGWVAIFWLPTLSPGVANVGYPGEAREDSPHEPAMEIDGVPADRVTSPPVAARTSAEPPTIPPYPDPSDIEPVWDGLADESFDLGPPMDADLAWMLEGTSAEGEPVDLGLPLDADVTLASAAGAEVESWVDLGEPLDADTHFPSQGQAEEHWAVDLGESLDADASP